MDKGNKESFEDVYTVTSLLHKLGISAQVDILKKLNALVKVQGVVRKVKSFQRSVYFELATGDERLSVKTSFEHGIQEGEFLVVEGFPVLRPSRFNTGIDVVLEGRPIGTWETREVKQEQIEIVKNSYLKLADYISTFNLDGVKNLLVLGSETGISDVQSNIQNKEISDCLRFEKIVVSRQQPILEAIEKASRIGVVQGIAIVRGGDDSSLDIFDDPKFVHALIGFDIPLYLALGHSHKTTLADRYADESFNTPSSIAHALMQSIVYQTSFQEKVKEIETLTKRNLELEKNIVKIETLNNKPISSIKMVQVILVALVFSVLAFLAGSANANAEVVKKSRSGICHDAGSSFYKKTNNFISYESLNECIKAGGRLPKNYSKTLNAIKGV